MAFRVRDGDQASMLRTIAQLIDTGSHDPSIVRAARAITADVDARDELSELQAIYDAVKHGTKAVPGLEHGLRYVADPRSVDFYTGAARMLKECKRGSCGGDCDEHTVLVGALCAALGFQAGARAWGSLKDDAYSHVYCVVRVPKRATGEWKESQIKAMDTTVADFDVGDQPPSGRIATCMPDEED